MGERSWEQLWPSHCRNCHGYGEYRLDHRDPNTAPIYKTCASCIGKRKCPRCGMPNGVSDIQSSCPCCGWRRGDRHPDGMLTKKRKG